MVEILRAPSGVGFAVAFLKAQYTARGESAGVGSKIRAPRPPRFTKVRLMGGIRPDIARYAPMITFECWGRDAQDELVAEDLGTLTESLINSLPDLDSRCSRVTEVGGLAWQPDPDSGAARYVFTKQLYLRSDVLV